MALLPPNSGGGPGGSGMHADLGGRDAADSHPMSAVTGLNDAINNIITATDGLAPLAYRYLWSATQTQDVPAAPSSVVRVIRASDGASIHPGLRHVTPDTVRLTFSPLISGDHTVYVVR